MSQSKELIIVPCPICNKTYPSQDIEQHANKCIFLNCPDDNQKRKRSPSPVLSQDNFLIKKSPSNGLFSSTQSTSTKNDDTRKIAPLFRANNNKSAISINNSNHKSSPLASEIIDLEEEREDATRNLKFDVPLAKQMQPKSLNDFFGQNHVLGKNTVLRSLLEKHEVPNMILWGPPGCGKTSLSSVIQGVCKSDPIKWKFASLCAATVGTKDVQKIISIAKNDMKFGKRTVLFMDEIHRFNKSQQDTFLLSVEKGEITLIGATTENPSFYINSALLSRCRVIVMEKLKEDDLYSILEKAAECLNIDVIDVENPCGFIKDDTSLGIENTALKWLADISDGDARIALSNLQLALQYCNENGKIINICDIETQIKDEKISNEMICVDENCVLLVEPKHTPSSSPTDQTIDNEKIRIKVKSFSELSDNCSEGYDRGFNVSSQPRKCTKCQRMIQAGIADFFFWQTMDFCSYTCLKGYMKSLLPKQCSNCKKFTSSIKTERFVCRMNGIYVFCSRSCMITFTATIKTCLYCQIITNKDNRICSSKCQEKYININIPKTAECFNCTQCKLAKVSFVYKGFTYLLCGESCLEELGTKKMFKSAQCNACNKYFDNSENSYGLRWDESSFTFCSLDCQSYFIALNKSKVKCKSCVYMGYTPDMIIKVNSTMQKTYYCNSLCYYRDMTQTTTLNETLVLPSIPTSVSTNSSSLNLMPVETISSSNRASSSSFVFVMPTHQPEIKNVATLCTVRKCDKSIQTEPEEVKKKLIPVPVPIYIPTPTYLYTPVPKPVLISAPYPVPVFIPTTRNSYDSIIKDIAKLKSELPDDPQQADLIMMAKAVTERAKLETQVEDENKADLKDSKDGVKNSSNTYQGYGVEEISPASDQMIDEIIGNDDQTVDMMAFSIALSVEDTDKDEELTEFHDAEVISCTGEELSTILGRRAFLEWAKDTKTKISTIDLLKISSRELNQALCSMVKEIRKPNGEEYASDTLYHLCLSIQKYLYINKRHENLFCDETFQELVDTLYTQMKQAPIINNSNFIITRISEELLWESYQLGCRSPYNLLFTIMYNNAKYFNFTTVDEHLSLNRSQLIRLNKFTKKGEPSIETCIVYNCKQDGEKCKELSSEGHSIERNPIALYDFYLEKLPRSVRDSNTFYFKPERMCIPESPIWYSTIPLERDAIEKMLQFIMVVKEVVIANIHKLNIQ